KPPFASGGMPLAAGARLPPGHPGLNYTTPDGWTKAANTQFSVLTFRVQEGGRTAEVTVSPLGGPAGGLLANVNRWRGQLGMPPATEADLAKEVRQLTVAGAPAPYVDLGGPEAAGGQRILAVAAAHGGQTWFIKMKGPADVVGKQKAAFEAFAASVKFE